MTTFKTPSTVLSIAELDSRFYFRTVSYQQGSWGA